MHGEMAQRWHFASTIFFHYARLSGLAKELVEALANQAITPLGTAKIRLCQEILASSSATRAAIAPWTLSLSALTLQTMRNWRVSQLAVVVEDAD